MFNHVQCQYLSWPAAFSSVAGGWHECASFKSSQDETCKVTAKLLNHIASVYFATSVHVPGRCPAPGDVWKGRVSEMPQQTKQCMQQLRRVMKSGARGEQTEGVRNKAKSGRRLRRWAVKGILARNALQTVMLQFCRASITCLTSSSSEWAEQR